MLDGIREVLSIPLVHCSLEISGRQQCRQGEQILQVSSWVVSRVPQCRCLADEAAKKHRAVDLTQYPTEADGLRLITFLSLLNPLYFFFFFVICISSFSGAMTGGMCDYDIELSAGFIGVGSDPTVLDVAHRGSGKLESELLKGRGQRGSDLREAAQGPAPHPRRLSLGG